jgi:hypothetical protein
VVVIFGKLQVEEIPKSNRDNLRTPQLTSQKAGKVSLGDSD